MSSPSPDIQVFRSGISALVFVPIFALVLGLSGVFAFQIITTQATALAPGLLILIAVGAFLIWILQTHYIIGDGKLKIIAGPFRQTVALADIIDATPTRSPLSAPAASLDRLEVRTKDGLSVVISPADKQGFLAALDRHRA